MTDRIIISIANHTGGSADIILFCSGDDGVIRNGRCSLAKGETGGAVLTVPVTDTLTHRAISVLVKDGPNAGYYISQDDGGYEFALDAGSHSFSVDASALTLPGGRQQKLRLAAPRPDRSAPPISHVFVVMLENRSFDHMLAFSGIPNITAATKADKNTYRVKGATSAPDNPAAGGVDALTPHTCYVRPGRPDPMTTDPGHEFPDVVTQLCGEFASFHAPA